MRRRELKLSDFIKIAVPVVPVIQAHGQIVAFSRISHIRGVVHPYVIRPFQKPRRTIDVGSDVQAHPGLYLSYLLKAFYPFFPKKSIKSESFTFCGRMIVILGFAYLFRKTVYFEISNVILLTKFENILEKFSDIIFVRGKYIFLFSVKVITCFFKQPGVFVSLGRISASWPEPYAESAAEGLRKRRFF